MCVHIYMCVQKYIFLRESLALLPMSECSGAIIVHCSFEHLGSNDPLALAPRAGGITGMSHRAWLVDSLNNGPGKVIEELNLNDNPMLSGLKPKN